MKNPDLSVKLVGVKDAAKIIGLSEWTLRKWAYSGEIASHKVSTKLMISVEEIDRVIRETLRPRRKKDAAKMRTVLPSNSGEPRS